MADFGIKSTNITAPDMSSASYIRPGVEDKSAATRTAGTTQLIKDVGTQALDAYKGNELAKLEAAQTPVIAEYMDRRNPNDLALQAGSLAQTRANLFLADEDESKIAGITKQFQDTTARYQKAVEQGVMSPEEFATRMLDTTRQAVNRNPGLYKDYIEHSKKIMELSGISTFVDADLKARNALALQQQHDQQKWNDAARELGISQSDPLMREKILEHNAIITKFNLFQKADGYTDIQRKAIINDPTQLNSIFNGASTSLALLGGRLAEDVARPASQRIAELTLTYNQEKRKLLSNFGTNAGDKQVQDQVKLLDDQFELHKGIIDKTIDAKYGKNLIEYRKSAAEANIGAPEMAAMVPFYQVLSDSQKAQLGGSKFFKAVDDMVNGRNIQGINWDVPNTPQLMLQFGNVALDEAKIDKTHLEKLTQAFHNSIFSDATPPETSINMAKSFINIMGQKGKQEEISKLSPEVRSQALTDSKTFLNLIATKIGNDQTFPDNTPLVHPTDLQIHALGDGTIIFQSKSDDATAQKLTKYYGKDLTSTLQTMANLNGHGDVKQLLQSKESGLLQAIQTMSGGQSGLTQKQLSENTDMMGRYLPSTDREIHLRNIDMLQHELKTSKDKEARKVLMNELDNELGLLNGDQ